MSVFRNVSDVLEYLVKGHPVGQFDEQVPFEWVHTDDGRHKAISSPPPPYLYRGQTALHTPCVPTIYRPAPQGKWTKPAALEAFQAEYILNRVRVAQFEQLMRQHPIGALCEEEKLWISYDALAQHYELATDLLDLTASAKVAAFFASAQRAPDGGSWEALGEEAGEGVIYRVHYLGLRTPYRAMRSSLSYFWCVGQQPAGRPGMQRAWAMPTSHGADFDEHPLVERLVFKHDRRANQDVVDEFSGGNALYPRDSVTRLAEMVKQCPVVPMKAIEHALSREECPPELRQAHIDRAIRLIENVCFKDVVEGWDFRQEIDDLQYAAVEAQRLRDVWRRGIGFRLMRTRKP